MPRRPSGEGVVGVDPSLTCTALVYLPPWWDPGNPLEHLEYETGIGYPLKEDATPDESVRRLESISLRVSLFVERHRCSRVYVENHAYAQSAYSGIKLGELSGAVKVTLRLRNEVSAVPVHMQSARRIFLGLEKCPKKAQVLVARRVREMGFPFATSDPGDALVVCSWGRTELGMSGIICG